MIIHSFIALSAFLSIIISQTRNTFMSLIYSILLYINAFFILLALGFEFLAVIQVLVYVGALAVLFLFVIMLLEIPSTELRAYYRGYSALALLGLISLKCYYNSISNLFHFKAGSSEILQSSSYTIITFIPTLESISNVGYAFYIRYADVLILNSLVLTIALFGALVLAHTRT